ncbi:MAG: response regulator [Alphaproteobacteria bacterium]|nr:response regulator [Alphaproteobacteria bacterium]
MQALDWGKVKVLIIEDEVHTRSIIRQLLGRLMVRRIEEASEGKEGINKAVNFQPDIIFCDIHMEPVDGLKFLGVLRSMKSSGVARTPVIFLTADAEQETVIAAKKLDVDGYLVKPVSAADLKKRILHFVPPMP